MESIGNVIVPKVFNKVLSTYQ